jgi:hypothetical protein
VYHSLLTLLRITKVYTSKIKNSRSNACVLQYNKLSIRAAVTFACMNISIPQTPVRAPRALAPTFNARALWAPNKTAAGFTVQWERASAAASGGAAKLDWEVRSAPWPGTPTPKIVVYMYVPLAAAKAPRVWARARARPRARARARRYLS